MRTALVVRAGAIALTAACGLTACGGSSGASTAASTTPSPTASASATAAATANAQVSAAVTAAYQKFFDPSTPSAQKLALLQNGQQFAAALQALGSSSFAKEVSVKVNSVSVVDATHASVKFDVLLNGTPTLTNQTGAAVKSSSGQWQVADSTLCALLSLQGSAPANCPSASPSTTTSPAG